MVVAAPGYGYAYWALPNNAERKNIYIRKRITQGINTQRVTLTWLYTPGTSTEVIEVDMCILYIWYQSKVWKRLLIEGFLFIFTIFYIVE
jgi:hypothetical protein